jgi:hypothetical protein
VRVNGNEQAAAGGNTFGARATDLRRAVNASRARLSEQRLLAERLSAELEALRARATEVRPAAAAPAAKEAVSDSARVGAASFATERRPRARYAVPLAAPVAALTLFVAFQQFAPAAAPAPEPPARVARPAPARPPLPPLSLPAATVRADEEVDGAQRALLLAGGWREPDDGRTLDERFGPAVDLPGAAPAWDAERTGERTYAVTRRAPSGDVYEFEVDVALDRVAPAPETRRRLSPLYVAQSRAGDERREP